MSQGTAGESRDRALGRAGVDLISAPSPSTRTRSSPSLAAAARASSSVSRSLRSRVEAPGRDPRAERELVDEVGDLLRGRVDHLDVARRRLLELALASERLPEAVDGRERRTQVVTREQHQARELVRLTA